MSIFKIEKPDLSKVDKDKFFELFLDESSSDLQKMVAKTYFPEYIYWDKVKYKSISKEFSKEDFWAFIKFFRRTSSLKTVIKSESGEYFSWNKLPQLEEFLHEADLNTGGSLFAFTDDIDEKNKHKFVSRGVMEEAIASSQLEGAATTRRVAKKFLREGKKPRNKSEQMILNNYVTMRAIEEDYKNRKLTVEVLFELHSMITKDTIDPGEEGRFRTDAEKIVVADEEKDIIYHIPPKMEFVNGEIKKFINFANDDLRTSFVHPIIKAIMLHFWIGYLHPFTDGNGRLARLLFYWYLLKSDYWAFSYIPISKVIKKSWGQYRDAYVYSEQDDLDLSYFIDYNIRKIKIALDDFKKYVKEKSLTNKTMNKLSRLEYSLNDRQIHLLQYLYENKGERTSPTIHMNVNQVAKITALKDLRALKEGGFLISKKSGRNVYYYSSDKVEDLFK